MLPRKRPQTERPRRSFLSHDPAHPSKPKRSRRPAQGRGGRAGDPVPRLAGQPRHSGTIAPV